MKKLTLILAVALLAASCDFDVERPDGPSDNGLKKYTESLEILQKDWRWNEETGSYYFLFNNVEYLTPYVIDNGLYAMYFQAKDGNILIHESLPMTSYEDEQGYLWEYTVTCDYSDYRIGFYIRNSDFHPGKRPPTMRFRLVVIW